MAQTAAVIASRAIEQQQQHHGCSPLQQRACSGRASGGGGVAAGGGGGGGVAAGGGGGGRQRRQVQERSCQEARRCRSIDRFEAASSMIVVAQPAMAASLQPGAASCNPREPLATGWQLQVVTQRVACTAHTLINQDEPLRSRPCHCCRPAVGCAVLPLAARPPHVGVDAARGAFVAVQLASGSTHRRIHSVAGAGWRSRVMGVGGSPHRHAAQRCTLGHRHALGAGPQQLRLAARHAAVVVPAVKGRLG